MIRPEDPKHRQRLSKALDYGYQEIQKYNRLRAVTVQAYLGLTSEAKTGFTSEKKYRQNLPKGNLLQLAGLSHQIALAYGEPQVIVKARTPENVGLADKLGPALNRMGMLLDLGEIHRNVAADSYFGYGIYKVAVGFMPPAARIATGVEVGPCIWRVGQNNFLYDITAENWSEVSYVGDMYTMSLEAAQILYPEHADRLTQYTDADRLDAPHVLPRPTRMYSPQEEILLVDLYFPSSQTVATWPVRADAFGTVSEEPLVVRDYKGHWSGVYQVLNHLYCPDELVPVAQAESVKAIHFLFNDIMQLTSEQARNAKVNPIYQAGADKDMQRIWKATDRHPVSVTDPNRFSSFEIPGPTQSQTAYMASLYNFFREFNPIFDDPAKAPTATQGSLERATTNAVVAEARRKSNRALQLVYYKLGHLLVNDQEIELPASRPLRPGSDVPLDVSWRPGPRKVRIDDFDISIEPFSTVYRSPEERLQYLLTASQSITQSMMLAAQGAPVNVEKVIDTFATLGNEPLIREWYEEQDPLAEAKKASSQQSVPRIGVGEYTRRNVSEKTNQGALEANLNQAGSENGAAVRVGEG